MLPTSPDPQTKMVTELSWLGEFWQTCRQTNDEPPNRIKPIKVGKTKTLSKSYTLDDTLRTSQDMNSQSVMTQLVKTNQPERIEACREVNQTINEAKTENWKEVLEGAMSNTDRKDMWKVINGLNSTPEANSPNEAMSHNGCTITGAKGKTTSFSTIMEESVIYLWLLQWPHQGVETNWPSIYRWQKLLQTHRGWTYICYPEDETERSLLDLTIFCQHFLKLSVQLPFKNSLKSLMIHSCMLIVQEFGELLPLHQS